MDIDKINDLFNRPIEPHISFSFYHDWDSFIFWKPYNWRNFTLINFYIETNNYSRWLEVQIALLGFHFGVDWYRKIK